MSTDTEIAGTAALNQAQAEAVAHDDGALLVIAGAGSGKTRVLTERIARLVRERDVPPDRILAVTFTNKAAGEMRERVAQRLGREPRGLWIGTFHAVGARLVRRYAERVGRTSSFTIYDTDDAEALVRRVMDDLGVSPKQWSPRAVAGRISDAKNALVSPADFRQAARDDFHRATALVFERMEQALERANAVTFDDLLTLPVAILRGEPAIARSLSERFRYVLVDEYQDTNIAQYQLVKQLGAHGNVFVVGDDDQSIYGWRGADIRNILGFERDFPAARVVRLEENYRSTPAILDFANVVIAGNEARRGKTLRATRPPGAPVTLLAAADDRDEAEFVVDEILTLRSADRSLVLGSFAVLYRTNAQSRPLEDELRKRAMPYRLIGQVRFYERREVRDIVAWLRLIANPADDEAFRRAIGAPRRGIGGATLAVVAAAARAAGTPMLDAARSVESLSVRAAAKNLLAEFAAVVDDLRASAPDMAVDELLEEILERTGYPDWLRGEEPDAEDRLANIESLVEGAAEVRDELEGEAGLAPLDLFLQRIALVTSADEADPDEGAVTLMTLHNAKGLEYPVVFVTGLEDGLLPLVRGGMEDAAGVEEERRLFYVGITRAEDRLYVTHAQRRWRNGQSMPSMPSRFLREVSPDAAETRRTLRARASAPHRAVWHDDSAWPAPTHHTPRRGTPVVWEDANEKVPVDDESQDAPMYRVGERVRHVRFGSGTIVELGGQGAAAKARIDFDDESVGRKTLMLAQAHLERGWE